MAKKLERLEADVVIAGGGPGGCSIAKELSKKGKKVILLERGGYDKSFFGTPLGMFTHLDKFGMTYTKEGQNIIQGVGIGGGTLVYAGAAFTPPPGKLGKYGIDITQELEEAKRDCWVQEVPDRLMGAGTKHIMAVAQDLGYPWAKLDKFVDPAKCRTGCMDCVVGCRRDAKWSGIFFADEAVRNGATILPNVKVTEVIVEQGTAGGVKALGRRGKEYQIFGKVVVCCAGGIETARILQRSGLRQAGSWFSGDPSLMVFGFVKNGKTTVNELGMVAGFYDEEHGVLFADSLSPRWSWHAELIKNERLRSLRSLHRFGKAMGVLAKITDENQGQVPLEGKPSKTLTDTDKRRLKYGREVAEKI